MENLITAIGIQYLIDMSVAVMLTIAVCLHLPFVCRVIVCHDPAVVICEKFKKLWKKWKKFMRGDYLPQSILLHASLVGGRRLTMLKFGIKKSMRHAVISQTLLTSTMIKFCPLHSKTCWAISCCDSPCNSTYCD